MAEVKLYGFWGSSFSRRIELALKLKGIEYEFIDEDLTNKSPQLLQYNPIHKKVPVLLHNGKPIPESLVILEYIDETWRHGPSILPKDPYDRAMARFWARFIDDKIVPAVWTACWGAGEEQVKAKEEAGQLLKFLDKELQGKRFFGGDSIGLVDIVATFVAVWSVVFGELVGLELLTHDKFPNLCAWKEEYLNSSSVKGNLPDREKLADLFAGLFLRNK